MADMRISDLSPAAVLHESDLLETSQPDENSASGYASVRITDLALATFILKSINFADLSTTAKNVIGAINEVMHIASIIPTFSVLVVQTLPTQDISETTIYLTPSQNPQTQDAYDEFIYVNNAWEHVGSTAVDLSAYYTKLEVDGLLATKANTADVSAALALKENTADMEEDVTDIVVDLTDTQETAEGNPVTLQTVQEGYAKAVTIKLTPKQDLHGYDKPWPGGAGKNKADDNVTFQDPSDTSFANTTKRTFGSKTYFYGLAVNNYFRKGNVTDVTYVNGVFSYKATSSGYSLGIPLTGLTVGQTYTASATLNANAIIRGVAFYAQDGTWLTGATATTITIPSDTYYTCLLFSTSTENTECTVSNIQLEEGSTATSYAPYANICPIEGYEEASATRTGKNLFNFDVYDTYKQSDGTYRATGYQFQSAGNIAVPQTLVGKTITFSAYIDETKETPYPTNLRVRAYHNGGYILGNAINGTKGISKITFTPSSGDTISIGVGSSSSNYATIDWFMLELGEGTEAYEPYDGATATAEFDETIYGAEGDAAGGEWEKQYKTVDLGSFNWSKGNRNVEDTGYVYSTNVTSRASGQNNILFDSFNKRTGSLVWERLSLYDAYPVGQAIVIILDVDTPAEAKTFLTGKYVCYELATPEPFQTAPAPLTLRKGDNTITTDGDSVKVKYNKLALPDIGCLAEYISALEARVAALEGGNSRSLSLVKAAISETKEEQTTEETDETEDVKNENDNESK